MRPGRLEFYPVHPASIWRDALFPPEREFTAEFRSNSSRLSDPPGNGCHPAAPAWKSYRRRARCPQPGAAGTEVERGSPEPQRVGREMAS